MKKTYEEYLKDFWTDRRRLNLRENFDIIKGPGGSEMLEAFRLSFFPTQNSGVEMTIMDGKNGEVPVLCNIKGIELLSQKSVSNYIIKIKFTMVRGKSDGQLHRKGYEYSIFDEVEIITAESVYITEIEQGYTNILE